MIIQNEIWKDIKDYKGIYQVSNLGRVRSLDKLCNGSNQYGDKFTLIKKGKILKPKIRKNGYLEVTLVHNKKAKSCLIHRLVANAFIENDNDYKYINHKDENKQNNRVDNLEWCTQSYNINFGSRNKKVSDKLKNKIRPKEWCKNISKAKKGKTMSIEFREKQKELCSNRLRNTLGQFVRSDSK